MEIRGCENSQRRNHARGLRVGQGRKPRALLDKLPDNPGKRPLKVMDLPEGADLPGEDMPEPKAT